MVRNMARLRLTLLIIMSGLQHLIARPAVSEENRACSRCINCLEDRSAPPGRQKREIVESEFDSGLCPSPNSMEYCALQQIEYMFRGVDESDSTVPCLAECSICRSLVHSGQRHRHRRESDPCSSGQCQITPLDQPLVERSFPGLFMTRAASNKNNHHIRKRSLSRCTMTEEIKPFQNEVLDDQGVRWYAVSFKNNGTMKYQFYVEIQCRNVIYDGLCLPRDHLITILMTTKVPHPVHHHTFSIFYFLGQGTNIKFHYTERVGRCEHQLMDYY